MRYLMCSSTINYVRHVDSEKDRVNFSWPLLNELRRPIAPFHPPSFHPAHSSLTPPVFPKSSLPLSVAGAARQRAQQQVREEAAQSTPERTTCRPMADTRLASVGKTFPGPGLTSLLYYFHGVEEEEEGRRKSVAAAYGLSARWNISWTLSTVDCFPALRCCGSYGDKFTPSISD